MAEAGAIAAEVKNTEGLTTATTDATAATMDEGDGIAGTTTGGTVIVIEGIATVPDGIGTGMITVGSNTVIGGTGGNFGSR
jgi:hypothetical protein